MILSCLLIDMGDNPDRPRPGRIWLRNLYRVHQRLCMAFPSTDRKSDDRDFLLPYDPNDFAEGHVHVKRDTNAGFLFRIDSRPPGRKVILVQSAIEPDWEYAFRNAQYLLAAPPQVKKYNPSFEKGQKLRFRLLANPTKKMDTKSGPDGKRRNGKRVPVNQDGLKDWLVRKAEPAGFTVDPSATAFQTGCVYLNDDLQKKGRNLRSARFDGILQVSDPVAFEIAVARGFGSSKGFGFGLMSVAPVQ